MKKQDIEKLEELGYVADSSTYRENLLKLLNENHNAETLREIQEQLKKIKKSAKKNGLFTKEELFKKDWTLEYAIKFYQENQKKILFEKLSKNLENKNQTKNRKI